LEFDAAEGLQPQGFSAVLRCRRHGLWAGAYRRAQVVSAFEKKEKPAVVWLHFQECTCCSESFIRATHPIVIDALLDVLTLNYSETLMAASGFQAEKCLSDTIEKNKASTLCWWRALCPPGTTASTA
jgi:NiFe hydrogenase small subunit HydA